MGYSVPEVRRLLNLLGGDPALLAFHLHWSLWRREHQWQARQAHSRRRARRVATVVSVPEASPDLPAPLVIAGLPALTPAHWDQIAPLLPLERTAGRPYRQHRQILDGMLWVMTTGTSWRQLPATFGPWETVYYRFQRWKREGLWDQILHLLLTPMYLSVE